MSYECYVPIPLDQWYAKRDSLKEHALNIGAAMAEKNGFYEPRIKSEGIEDLEKLGLRYVFRFESDREFVYDTWKKVKIVDLDDEQFAQFESWVRGAPDPNTGIRMGQTFKNEPMYAVNALMRERQRREDLKRNDLTSRR